jgi:hypothetical protein
MKKYMQFSRRLLLILFVRKTDPFMLNITILLKYAIYVSNLRTIIGFYLKSYVSDFIPVVRYNYSS